MPTGTGLRFVPLFDPPLSPPPVQNFRSILLFQGKNNFFKTQQIPAWRVLSAHWTAPLWPFLRKDTASGRHMVLSGRALVTWSQNSVSMFFSAFRRSA